MYQVYAVVYNPLNMMQQQLLGEFKSYRTPKIVHGTSDIFNVQDAMFVEYQTRSVLAVGVTDSKKVIVGINPPERNHREFYRTNKINRVHPWAWRDDRGTLWVTSEEFGRYLSHLIELN